MVSRRGWLWGCGQANLQHELTQGLDEELLQKPCPALGSANVHFGQDAHLQNRNDVKKNVFLRKGNMEETCRSVGLAEDDLEKHEFVLARETESHANFQAGFLVLLTLFRRRSQMVPPDKKSCVSDGFKNGLEKYIQKDCVCWSDSMFWRRSSASRDLRGNRWRSCGITRNRNHPPP